MLKMGCITMGWIASSWIIDLDPFIPPTAQGWVRQSPQTEPAPVNARQGGALRRKEEAGQCLLRCCPVLALGEEWDVQKGARMVTLVAFPPREKNTGRAAVPQPFPPITQPENQAPGFRSRRGQSSRVPGKPSVWGNRCAFWHLPLLLFKRNGGIIYCILKNGKHKVKENFQCQVQGSRMNSSATCPELDCSCVHFDRDYFQWRRTDIHEHIFTQEKKIVLILCRYQYTEKEIRKTSFYFFLLNFDLL